MNATHAVNKGPRSDAEATKHARDVQYSPFGDDASDSTAEVDGIIDAASTRREMLLVARNLRIPGAWRMSKSQLSDRIAAARRSKKTAATSR